ncbi:hypothetical protein HYPP_03096 [Hyphomicrobium sp. ghe19]|nr:hypothetical protein HYPP_03096 [Hyphomicrobium sp. ghe19]
MGGGGGFGGGMGHGGMGGMGEWAVAASPGPATDSAAVLWAEIPVDNMENITLTEAASEEARSSYTATTAITTMITTAIGAMDGSTAATAIDEKAPVIRGFFMRASRGK